MNHVNGLSDVKLQNASRILLYTVGAFGRYYICWQDKAGKYHQDGHNLPRRLHDWLFPHDGPLRDFETLQVSLLHDDEFCAFDKNDRITNLRTAGPVIQRQSAPDRLMIRGLTQAEEYKSGQPGLVRRQTYTSGGERRRASRRTNSLAAVPFTRRWSMNTPALGISSPIPEVLSGKDSVSAKASEMDAIEQEGSILPSYDGGSEKTSDHGPIEAGPSPSPKVEAASSCCQSCGRLLASAYPMTKERQQPASYSESRLRATAMRVGAMSLLFRKPGYRLGDALLCVRG